MIGLEPEEQRSTRNDGSPAPRESARPPQHDEIEDVWDDEDYEDWLFL